MTLKNLKIAFKKELSEIYPSEEIDSFFYLLAEEYLNLSPVQTVLHADQKMEESVFRKFQEAWIRLKKHEPIQYILGSTEFFGLRFKVTKNTLIPRPETEELVQWILKDLKKMNFTEKVEILDIGTGSGCIAISLEKNSFHTAVSAIDISEKALETARENAELHQSPIRFLNTDILQTDSLNRTYNIIVSNPPYVRFSEKEMMKENVLNFEPETALFVNDKDPLVFYRKIGELSKTGLKPGGRLYFEINEYLALELVNLMKNIGFTAIELKKDIYGKERMLRCEWK